MNQPVSACRTHYEDLIRVASALQSGNQTSHGESYPIPEEDQEVESSTYTNLDVPMDASPDDPDGLHSNNPTIQHFQPPVALQSESLHVKLHPTAAEVFGYGETYMDKFNKDDYAQHRKDHLYYPFASRGEWEVALFLLRSHLSMGSIDSFLKLELASLEFL